ncbi:hypothetical protein A54_129 [Septuagintavirus sv54]|uniref:Uncharacterized protein n=1 Tax=Escherichia phage A5-4 TaxID=2996162 RepID=A0AAE9PTL3_9CAUD|nr:hypothetical protein A54_129 [Escherichia phage A5-4]
MAYEAFKEVYEILIRDWNWKKIRHTGYIRPLIYTSDHSFRRDMKISQRVGKTKFKFQRGRGYYDEGFKVREVPRFCVSTLPSGKGEGSRISWMATCNNEIFIAIRKARHKDWQIFNLDEYFEDTQKPTDDEIEFVNILYPEFIRDLPKLKPGLDAVHKELQGRFGVY